MKAWAADRFTIPPDTAWRTITPLSRAPIPAAHPNLLLVGDAARVVEPFTGEGIYYALASGELAARHLLADDLPGFNAAHAKLYRGRLWVNHLARAAVLRPWLAEGLLAFAGAFPQALRFLTAKVIGPAPSVIAERERLNHGLHARIRWFEDNR